MCIRRGCSKTKSFAAAPYLAEVLEDWKSQQKKSKMSSAFDEAVVFPNKDGNMRTYNGFRTAYRRFLKRHGLENENLNLHRFRHTFATMLLENGVNPKIVQKLMGHKDIETHWVFILM